MLLASPQCKMRKGGFVLRVFLFWFRWCLNPPVADDQAEWMEKLRADQEEQSANYAKAMKEFQEQYVKQQAVYQQGLEEQQKQIQDWNRVRKAAIIK